MRLCTVLKSGHIVCGDNYFSSLSLSNSLLSKYNIHYLGTLRKNRREVPKYMNDNKGLPIFSSRFFLTQEKTNSILSYVTKKTQNVLLLSNIHFSKEIPETAKKYRPTVILDYNKHKGGVDKLDQMLKEFRIYRANRRWPVVLFFDLLGFMSQASWVIFCLKYPDNPLVQTKNRREFLYRLGRELVCPLIEFRKCSPSYNSLTHKLKKEIERSLILHSLDPPTSHIPTSSIPTSSIPTSSIPTSSIPTSSIPTSSISTSSIPTSSIPTSSIPTSSISTSSIPTSSIPTSSIPTSSIPTSSISTSSIPTSSTPISIPIDGASRQIEKTVNQPILTLPSIVSPTSSIDGANIQINEAAITLPRLVSSTSFIGSTNPIGNFNPTELKAINKRRCYLCPRLKDRKFVSVCHLCQLNICPKHSTHYYICSNCIEDPSY